MVGSLKGTVYAAALAAALAGCSVGGNSTATQSSGGSSSSNGSNGGNGGGGGSNPTFTVQVNFTGQDSLQGSFQDSQTGSGFSSCSDYATLVNANRPFEVPSGQNTMVNGKSVTYLLTVAATSFHGPGTYTARMAGGVSIGSDSFLPQNNSTINATVKSDGSGSASFDSLYQLSGSGNGNESGTITWTCSG
ncbi:MAG: hypothetical protein JO198_12520 [Candidatus Dormibacteraeota bacterium]|nr:hypothetical protein [Candidatus Dormibacteraeota bacterium]